MASSKIKPILRICTTRTFIIFLKHGEHSAFFFPTKCYVVYSHNIRVSHKDKLKFKCPLPALRRKLESVKEEAALALCKCVRRTRTEKSEDDSQDNRSATKIRKRNHANKQKCPPFGREVRQRQKDDLVH